MHLLLRIASFTNFTRLRLNRHFTKVAGTHTAASYIRRDHLSGDPSSRLACFFFDQLVNGCPHEVAEFGLPADSVFNGILFHINAPARLSKPTNIGGSHLFDD